MSKHLFTSKKSVGFYEVMATSYSSPTSTEPTYTSNNLETSYQQRSANMSDPRESIGSNSGKNHVDFHVKREEDKVKKTKYLTAKYGQHQMMLIRKRLAVEDWIYDELRRLYDCVDDSEDHNCPLDLEEILNFEKDNEKRNYIVASLSDCKVSQPELQKFTEDLLRKSKTL